ncbi:DHA2 family efflux MFS transporter permease subunit [Saccharothrix violaceirubra]|uniref:EmrB/QacA subfamily drug resistance transporter n=1 Tax=Saccharothrix violaceirubra TaxID=413306 RepID=A0A7W7T053_9PSEU|nr:MFS transporter [Saccharothrix violaceirubra]MBB4964162.1 EmrB/QacA subfamily drug resistance transporter [Saccharothrix violaceirubra]
MENGSRRTALAVLCVSALMVVVDQTVVSVALPAIRDDLGFTATGLAWVVNAYVLPFGGLLLLSGRMGDLLGRRRVFVAGVGVFTLASLCCGLAGNAAALVAARFAQGVGGAMATAVTLGMIVSLFPEPATRARALGVFGFVQASGGSLGSLLGGVVTHAVSWPWVFLVNVPIGVCTILVSRHTLPHETGFRTRVDVVGAALVTTGVTAAVYAVVAEPLVGVVAVASLGAFAWWETVVAEPLLPPRLLRSRTLVGANVVQALMVGAAFGFLFFSVLYLRERLSFDALTTGLGMLPVAVVIGAVSLGLSARLTTRFGERPVLATGLVLLAAGLAGFALGPSSYLVTALPAMVALGTGFGLAMPASTMLGMAAATERDAGVLSGVLGTTQQIGGAWGLAVLTVVAARGGYGIAFGTAAVFAIAALAVALFAFRSRTSVAA